MKRFILILLFGCTVAGHTQSFLDMTGAHFVKDTVLVSFWDSSQKGFDKIQASYIGLDVCQTFGSFKVFFSGSYDFKKIAQKVIKNNQSYHLRLMHGSHLECYLQKNKNLGLNQDRQLAGVGLFWKTSKFFVFGSSLMLEDELVKLTSDDIHPKTITSCRSSNYLNFYLPISNKIDLQASCYLQVMLYPFSITGAKKSYWKGEKYWRDVRFFGSTKINFKLAKNVSVCVFVKFFCDSKPTEKQEQVNLERGINLVIGF